MAYVRVAGIGVEKFRHEGNRHQREQMNVQAVEKPAQPGGEAGFPLGR